MFSTKEDWITILKDQFLIPVEYQTVDKLDLYVIFLIHLFSTGLCFLRKLQMKFEDVEAFRYYQKDLR